MASTLQPVENKSFAIASNGFSEGPVQALRTFLLQRGAARVTTVLHPLAREEGNRHLILDERRDGLTTRREVPLPSLPPFTYPLDLLVPLMPPAVDAWFGFNGLACLRGLAARKLGRADRVAYWCVDYVDERFGGSPLTLLYERLDLLCCRRADIRVELSEAARQARDDRHTGAGPFAPALVVPMGAWVEQVPRTQLSSFGARSVVFLGHLVPRQGVLRLLQAAVILQRELGPSFRVEIIGRGPQQAELRSFAAQHGISDVVTFHGYQDDFGNVARILAAATVAVAPYADDPESFTRYADPGKLKSYLAAGLPIIMTRVPPNADELAHAGAAVLVDDDAQALAVAIRRLLEEKQAWEAARTAALAEARRFDWPTVLAPAVEAIGYRP